MVSENPTWGAPHIHGELLKLGFEASERSASRWIRRAPRARAQPSAAKISAQASPIPALAPVITATLIFVLLPAALIASLFARNFHGPVLAFSHGEGVVSRINNFLMLNPTIETVRRLKSHFVYTAIRFERANCLIDFC